MKEIMVITRNDLAGVATQDTASLLERIRDHCRFLTLAALGQDNLQIVARVKVIPRTKRNGERTGKTISANVERRDLLHSMFPVHYRVERALEDRHIGFKRLRLEGWRSTEKAVVLNFRAE